jgi:Do/DeqQ family serine protease
MNVHKAMYSKKFLFLNLVLVGAILGFVLAVLLFSCSTDLRPGNQVEAQEAPRTGLVDAESLQSSFRSVALNILPAVVQLEVIEVRSGDDESGRPPWFDFFFGPPEGESPEDDEEDGRPQPEFRNEGIGSGVIVRRTGNTLYVLTNDHVAGGADEIRVTLDDQREYMASLVGSDPRKDLALISFTASESDIPVATLGDSDELQVGDWVLAVGSPFGFQSTVTAGIVSALERRGGPAGNISDFIQTDAAINRGNSGGPLVNLRGEVVGINTWITSQTGGSVGLGFSIPMNSARRAIDDFINQGEVSYGWLGVSVPEAPESLKEDLGLSDEPGALIYSVYDGSPAAEAGLRPGDYVTRIGGRRIDDSDELILVVGDLEIGESAEFRVLRRGEELRLTVTIGLRQDETRISAQARELWPGIQIVPLSEELRARIEMPDSENGVVVTSTTRNSPGAIADLRPGDVITDINGTGIASAEDYFRAINEDASEYAVSYIRDGVELQVSVLR